MDKLDLTPERLASAKGAFETAPGWGGHCTVEWADVAILLASHAALEARLREAEEVLEQIAEKGTQYVTQRVGDAYDPNGWQDYDIVSDEAELARAFLSRAEG